MASFGSSSVDYHLSKRHLPSSQIERVPNVEDLEEYEFAEDKVQFSSLRAANFLPPGMELGSFVDIPSSTTASYHSPLFSPVYTQLAAIKSQKLHEQSEEAQRLRRKLLRGSNVLIVQGGYSGKKFVYETLAELGVRVWIMDGSESYWRIAAEEGMIAGFIEIDFTDNATVFERAIDIVMSLDTKFDSVTTYYEDAVPLATRLAQALGFSLNPIEACDSARNKRMTREAMKSNNLPTPTFYSVKSADDLEIACKTVGFPAVLKPAFGAASLGVFKVQNEEETRRMYAAILETMVLEEDTIWTQGTEFILEEFYDGDEFDVDVLLFDGECVYAKMSDNWPCREPWFQETGLNSPSFYPEEATEALIKLAVDTAIVLGFKYGAFHIEVKNTSRGPRLIEVNARMGGVSVRDANLCAWGVDLVEEHCMAMLKIPIRPMIPPKFLKVFASIGLITPYDGVVANDDWLEHLRGDRVIDKITYEKKKGDKVTGPKTNLPDWLAEIRCKFDSRDEMIAWVNDKLVSLPVPLDSDDTDAKGGFFLPTHAYPFVEIR